MALRKDRVYEALQSLHTQRPVGSGVLRREAGFSAEEVAERAGVDRTNASRDLNQLAHEGIIERIPGRPVLFALKTIAVEEVTRNTKHEYSAMSEGNAASDGQAGFVETQQSSASPTIAASVKIGAVATSFETLIGCNDALKVAIQQAKAAILYPPRGLHTLLSGPSGVGKTTFARLMHNFALELNALPHDAPFVSFNCADYAGNPQLLMAHLFGVVKGAYTGADHDREGLVEQAHRGILFLDEVHRLPPEGQEMLFYLMDRERFRRLGDVHERRASLLLLAATTEDPTTTLLPTFRRRIPMTITLPGLNERTIQERYELLRAFFTTECSSIEVTIRVSPQALRALLLYECPGNVGQLRTDVQLACARAYLEYRTNNLPELHVGVEVLPEHVRRELLRTRDFHRILGPVFQISEATHIFTPTGLSLDTVSHSAQDLYRTINAELHTLRKSGLREDEISKLLNLDIQNYFQSFADTITGAIQGEAETISQLVDEHVVAVSRGIVSSMEEQLGRSFPEKLELVLALHLTSVMERTRHNQYAVASTNQAMRSTHPIEYEAARTAIQLFRSELGRALPDNEIDVLAVLFANADTLLSSAHASVGIVVAAHGRAIATGLADLANTLVGADTVYPVELTLEQSPEELLTQVVNCTVKANQGSGVLLLVDFASLLSLGELVAHRTGIHVRTVGGVSAPLVVEAVRRAHHSPHNSVDQLAASLASFHIGDETVTALRADELLPAYNARTGDEHEATRSPLAPRVILSVCLTGFGSATKLAELIEDRLPELRQQEVEILCMDINLSGKTADDVQQLVGHRHIVAIVGTINPHLESYPFISLTDMLFGDGIARLHTLLGGTLIDPALLQPETQRHALPANTPPIFLQRADLIREISYTLSQRLLFLNPLRVLPLIERMIELIEVEVGETFEIEVLAGFILHIACVLERGPQQKTLPVSERVREQVEQQFPQELQICRRAWHILSTQVARTLPEEEVYNIVGILRQVDIFSH